MKLSDEIKRKMFHHLALIYMAIYCLLPRKISLCLLGIWMVVVLVTEFLRLRRPELNAYFLKRFGDLYRPSEICEPSAVLWMILGVWFTMLIFTNPRIILPAIGFLIFGDAAAALVGKKYGTRPLPLNSSKTYEGSLVFFVVSLIWSLFFLRWPVAILGSIWGAWVEAKQWKWNDNLMIPLMSAAGLSILNLVLGR